jgi:hypothetical protein
MPTRDWDAEIDRWTERFRLIADPPEPFATALREGWSTGTRRQLAADAEAYLTRHSTYLAQLRASGVDLVRFDAKQGDCGVCRPYVGAAYSLGDDPELPAPPPLPICPACRHTLNMLTPFFLQSLGLDREDLVANAVPFVAPTDPLEPA